MTDTRLSLDDGTSYVDVTTERFADALYALHHGHELTTFDRYLLAGALGEYRNLVAHTLGIEHALKKLRLVARAARRKP